MNQITHKLTFLAAVLATFAGAGCAPSQEESKATTEAPKTSETATSPTPGIVTAYEVGSKKKGDMAICVVCNKKEGTTAEEEVKETLDYKGKTYAFCNEAEKAEFISSPEKYAVAN